MSNQLLLLGVAVLALSTIALVSMDRADSNLERQSTNDVMFNSNEYNQFIGWLQYHNKFYETKEEFLYRFSIFKQSLLEIALHNREAVAKGYKKGLTIFADISQSEFQSTYLNTKLVNNPKSFSNSTLIPAAPRNEFLNWTANGKVGPVNNQGKCGSCYSFAATESIQSAWAIFKGELPQLSEEQIVQCSLPYGNEGCGGGDPDKTYDYVMKHPLNTEDQYPYTSGSNGVAGACNTILEDDGHYGIDGYGCIEPLNCEAIVDRVNKQPLYIGVNASNWKLYLGGIYPPSDCATNHNHGVLLMGYGPDFWLIQNSWGTSWGEYGYIQISNEPNTCGSCSEPCYPVVHF